MKARTTKEILVNLLAVSFWDEHDREFLALFGESRINAGFNGFLSRRVILQGLRCGECSSELGKCLSAAKRNCA